jgi:hypothetical protein
VLFFLPPGKHIFPDRNRFDRIRLTMYIFRYDFEMRKERSDDDFDGYSGRPGSFCGKETAVPDRLLAQQPADSAGYGISL